MASVTSYRHRLAAELVARKGRNPAYSIRAFARDLKVSTTTLFEVLNLKRHFSKKNAERVAQGLGLPPKAKAKMLREIQSKSDEATPSPDDNYLDLEDAHFQMIAQWYHFAILSLIQTKGFQSDPQWIASRLKISPTEVKVALHRLHGLGLIHFNEADQHIERSCAPLQTPSGIRSEALRLYHKQNLKKAEQAIDQVPTSERHTSSVTVAMDAQAVAQVDTLIEKFRKDLSEVLESYPGSQVYTLAIQLFPVTQKEQP